MRWPRWLIDDRHTEPDVIPGCEPVVPLGCVVWGYLIVVAALVVLALILRSGS